MYALDFIYEDVQLSNFGFIICQFDESNGTNILSAGSTITFNQTSINSGKSNPIISTHYEECLTCTFDICKNPEIYSNYIDREITLDEERKMFRWLNRHQFLKFRFVTKLERPIWYMSSFNIEEIRVSDKLYGLRLTMTTDKPFGYGEQVKLTESNCSVNFKEIPFNYTGDEEGILPYDKIVLTTKVDADYKISCLGINNTYKDTIIKNCKSGEKITIDSKNKLIMSSNSTHKIYNDFNYIFPMLIRNWDANKNDGTLNIIKIGAIDTTTGLDLFDYEIYYSPIIKGFSSDLDVTDDYGSSPVVGSKNSERSILENIIGVFSDVEYIDSNLFNPLNITHNSRYVYSNGNVYTGTDSTACRTTELIAIDSSKEYNVMYYKYKTPNSKKVYLFKYNANKGFVECDQNPVTKTNSDGEVLLFHVKNTAYIGLHFISFSESYPKQSPQVMIWETSNENEVDVKYIEFGVTGGRYKLPNLVTSPEKVTEVIKTEVVKTVYRPSFYNSFLNISYSSFEGLAPANTLETYLTAAKLGFDAIKGDVRITSDDKLIMCHDAGFTFTDAGYIKGYVQSNSTPIRELTLEQCQSHLYSNSAAMATALGHSCKVATFEDYIKICREYNKVAYITVRDEYIDTIAPIVLDCLKKYNMLDNAIINSFTVESLQKFRALDSDIMLSNVLYSQVALTTSHIDTALSLGNCMVAIFAFPFDSADTVLSNSAAAITYAKEKGVLVYGAIAKTYSEYSKAVTYGLSGLHMQSLMFPYEPKRYCLKVTVSNGIAAVSDEFMANRYSATISQSGNTISLSNITVVNSDRGFDDGVMQLWLNKLPYVLDIKEETGKSCEISYSSGTIQIVTGGETSATYHLSITV